MAQIIGMDPVAVRQLAVQLRTQAESLLLVVGRVDNLVHQAGNNWSGADMTEFAQSWQRTHRPALVLAQDQVSGLAQSADNNSAQQDATSGAASGSPASNVLDRAWQDADSVQRKFGFLEGPAVGAIPAVMMHIPAFAHLGAQLNPVATVGGMALTGAVGAHTAYEDFRDGRTWDGAAEIAQTTGSEAVSLGMTTKDPALIIGGVGTEIVSADITAAHAIDWTSLYHDPGQLIQGIPGSGSAIWHSEISGFKGLGETVIGSL